jgi:2-methylisocitrate lyase-like PEP mutase family enzyme
MAPSDDVGDRPAGGPGARFRALLDGDDARPLVLPGCADALTARIAAGVGFEAVYATGAGIANAMLGRPDVGLTTMTEAVDQVARIVDAVEVPVIADIDTGFGNALNARRAVRAFERAGVGGIQIEDQVFPKRCGHFDHKEVIPIEEFLGKLRAVIDGRRDPAMFVIARTDVLAIGGLEAAIDRANRYVEAGADAIFVEAPPDLETLAALPRRIDAPLVANMVEGGRTPLLSAAELAGLGYAIVLFANTALRVTARASREALAELRRTGDAVPLMDRMLGWQERQDLVGLPEYEALERRYAGDGASVSAADLTPADRRREPR